MIILSALPAYESREMLNSLKSKFPVIGVVPWVVWKKTLEVCPALSPLIAIESPGPTKFKALIFAFKVSLAPVFKLFVEMDCEKKQKAVFLEILEQLILREFFGEDANSSDSSNVKPLGLVKLGLS